MPGLRFAVKSDLKRGVHRQPGEEAMEASKITEYAHALYDAHGDKAEFEAAQKARVLRDRGKLAEAETWHSIRKAISEMRGVRES